MPRAEPKGPAKREEAPALNELEGFFRDYFEGGEALPSKLPQILDLRDLQDDPVWVLDLKELNRHDFTMVQRFLDEPRLALEAAKRAILSLFHEEDQDRMKRALTTRLGDPTAILEPIVGISGLRTDHLFRLVAMSGTVVGLSQVSFKLIEGTYECGRCHAVIREPQGELEQVPLECYAEQGGCERPWSSTKFTLIQERSKWGNAQRIEIQENPETTEGQLPERLTLILYGKDLVRRLRGGNKVLVWGILGLQEPRGKERRTTRERYLEVQGYRVLEEGAGQMVITEQDVQLIEAVAKGPDPYAALSKSLAPHIVGHALVKEALTLQLFGGVERPHQRADIHQLLLGDPSVAKTQLLMAVVARAPRGMLVTASQATHAGLTAYVQQENVFGAVRWVAEAGAMPLADHAGILCIDEFDKMHAEDRRRINPALDPQEFTVVKAGANLKMVSRVPVLAAANPKMGRFDEHLYVSEQFEISPDTLSRFDCIWPMIDTAHAESDKLIAHRILDGNNGEELEVSIELFRKYIAYARRTNPAMTAEAKETIVGFYVKERQKSAVKGAVALTSRQLGALRRLAEASARIQLRTTVTKADAERAINIMSDWLGRVAGVTGVWDIDIIATGISQSQRERIIILREVINELEGISGSADRQDILARAEARGIPPLDVEKYLKEWEKQGDIYQLSRNKYKLISR